MCNANSCCKDLTRQGLINYLYLFTIINLILSVIAIFIRAADTDRYDEALMYLEARNNGTFKNFNIDDCKKGGLFKDDIYCRVNDKSLSKPSESVSFESIFKNWKTIELALNISRAVFTVIYILFLYFVIQRKNAAQTNVDDNRRENNLNLFGYLITVIGFMIFISGLWILLRSFAIGTNDDIGLYEEGNQNSFESKIAVNYIIDITEIVLYSIEICFGLRFKKLLSPRGNRNNNPPSTLPRINYYQPNNPVIPNNPTLYPVVNNPYPYSTYRNPPNQPNVIASYEVININVRHNNMNTIHPIDNF